MFTGIITEVGKVRGAARIGGGLRLAIEAPESARELAVGDSVSVSGACQTVVSRTDTGFDVEAVEETLRKTTLGALRAGSGVNLELAVRLNDRLGGHLVQGHVDGVGAVARIAKQTSSWLVTVEFAAQFSRYVVPVGSIALDGISLTVAAVEGNRLTVSLIPHTLEHTTLAGIREGDRINMEFDLIGKYVERLLQGKGGGEGLTMEKLTQWGYGGGV